jgi:hypothetical protein
MWIADPRSRLFHRSAPMMPVRIAPAGSGAWKSTSLGYGRIQKPFHHSAVDDERFAVPGDLKPVTILALVKLGLLLIKRVPEAAFFAFQIRARSVRPDRFRPPR